MRSSEGRVVHRRGPESVFVGGGDMGSLCRQMAWEETALGPVEGWPQSLRTAAGMVVAQGIAQNLCWGPDLLQIYNDAYRAIMADKHPSGLGRSVLWSWSEIRSEIEPLFERVLGGETVFFEDLLLRVERNGAIEDAYFTFSYSPVRVESGDVGGVLINAFETTRQVHARAVQSDRDRLLQALQVERARLEYVFQRSPSFLAVLRGRDYVFELANAAYFHLVGGRDLIGRTVHDALPEVIDQGFTQLLDGVMDTGEPFVGREVSVLLRASADAEPEERFLDFVYLAMVEPDGSRSGIIAHGYDVTDQVLARRQVELLLTESEQARLDAETARTEAEAANRAKADFLASMSHELRTPLNAIGGYVDLLELGVHGVINADQQKALQRIGTNQRHLLTLINDILAFAKVEAGRVEFDIEPLSAADVLAGMEPMLAPLALARGITCTIEECDPSIRLLGDDERVRQILLNLAGNAIKFTPPGGWVSLGCELVGERVHIRVSDSGPGIAPDKQQKIFDPFMQVDRQLNNPKEGVGLGLAISRDLARAMRGDLTVASEIGRGSTFSLLLPDAEPPTQSRRDAENGDS